MIWTSSLASSLASDMVATASFKRSLLMLTFPLSPFASCFFALPSVDSSFESCACFSLKAGFVRYCMPFTFSSASSLFVMHCCTKVFGLLEALSLLLIWWQVFKCFGCLWVGIPFAPAFASRGLIHDQRAAAPFPRSCPNFHIHLHSAGTPGLGSRSFWLFLWFSLCSSWCPCTHRPPMLPHTASTALCHWSNAFPNHLPILQGLLSLITIFLSWSPLAWCQWTW